MPNSKYLACKGNAHPRGWKPSDHNAPFYKQTPKSKRKKKKGDERK